MKRINFLILVLAIAVCSFEMVSFLAYAGTHDRRTQRIVPDAIYANHYREDEDTQIKIHGKYPGPCYSGSDFYEVKVDGEEREIEISDYAIQPEDEKACKKKTLSYVREISLGQLPAGNYKVYFFNAEDQRVLKGKIKVASSSDDMVAL